MELFKIGFLPISLIDLLDILLVTFVFYQVYRIMRGTRATQMFAGLLVLILIGSLAQLMGMSGISWLIRSIGAVWVIAFVILFQAELRRALTRIGEAGFMKTIFKTGSEKVIIEVARAAIELSKRRIGGLIVFQRTTGIRGVIETGVQLQAEVTWDLLVSIFYPRTPLHDGAVIISEGMVIAARCLLPLSSNPSIESILGTRHRAAIGITEEIDAIAVIISEESGSISVVEEGKLIYQDLNEENLRTSLTELLYPSTVQKRETETVQASTESSGQIVSGGGEIS